MGSAINKRDLDFSRVGGKQIAIRHHDVGEFADLQRAEIGRANQSGGCGGQRRQRLLDRQPALHRLPQLR